MPCCGGGARHSQACCSEDAGEHHVVSEAALVLADVAVIACGGHDGYTRHGARARGGAVILLILDRGGAESSSRCGRRAPTIAEHALASVAYAGTARPRREREPPARRKVSRRVLGAEAIGCTGPPRPWGLRYLREGFADRAARAHAEPRARSERRRARRRRRGGGAGAQAHHETHEYSRVSRSLARARCARAQAVDWSAARLTRPRAPRADRSAGARRAGGRVCRALFARARIRAWPCD